MAMRRSSRSGKVSLDGFETFSRQRMVNFREFLRLNDECADKIYDIRERSDLNREWLLNSDGVAPRFYQMEADAVNLSHRILTEHFLLLFSLFFS